MEEFESKVSDSESVSSESINFEDIKVEMATLRKVAAPNLEPQPLYFSYLALDRPLKLNSRYLNLLPKFHGLPGEDPYIILMNSLLHVRPYNMRKSHLKLGRSKPFLFHFRIRPSIDYITWSQQHSLHGLKFIKHS